jgi:hypothetical protein
MAPSIDPFEIALRYAMDLLKAREMTPHEANRRTAWTWALLAELERSKQRKTPDTGDRNPEEIGLSTAL